MHADNGSTVQIVSAATVISVFVHVSGNVACFVTRCVIIKPMHAPIYIDGFKMGNSIVTINEEEQVKIALTRII